MAIHKSIKIREKFKPAKNNIVYSGVLIFVLLFAGVGSKLLFTSHAASASLPAGVTLKPIDGGPNYYCSNGFTNACNASSVPGGMSWDDPRFFPIMDDYAFYPSDSTTIFKNLGLNTTLRVTSGTDMSTLKAAGIYAILDDLDTNYGTETVGWHIEEPNGWTGSDSVTSQASTFLGQTTGRFFQAAFTWNQFVYGFPSPCGSSTAAAMTCTSGMPGGVHMNMASADNYWFAASNTSFDATYPCPLIYNVSGNCSVDQIARGSNYGDMVDQMRGWLATYPAPVAPYIETDDGLIGTNPKVITPPELNWAVWDTIVHGARTILYFGETSDDGCGGNDFGFCQTIQSGQSVSNFTQAGDIDNLVKNLAPVINAPFALNYASDNLGGYTFPTQHLTLDNGLDISTHYYTGGSYSNSAGTFNNGFYIFASVRGSESQSNIKATFTTADKYTGPVTVVNAGTGAPTNYTIQATNGVINDTFANSTTTHIYQIPNSGSTTTPPPSTPTSVTTKANSATSVTVNWAASTDTGGPGLAGYHILRGGNVVGTVNANTLTYTDTTVLANTTYSYTVEAYDTSGNASAPSSASSVTTPPGPVILPTAPTGVSTKANSSTSVSVSWNASTDTGGPGLAGYHILRGGNVVGTVNSGTLTYTDTTVLANTTYSYTVEAYDTSGNASAPSSASSVTTPPAPVVLPTAPTNVTAKANSATSVTITWSASTDTGGPGLGGYHILRGGAVIGSVNASTLSYTDTLTAANTTYSYTVQAIDLTGNLSSLSTAATVTTPALPPTTPAALSATALSATSVKLTWSSSTDSGGPGLAGYHILRGGVVIASVNNSTLSYIDNSVIAKTTYSYTVEAFDTAGTNSGPSTAVVVTTPPLPDTQPPTVPTNVVAVSNSAGNSVTVTWSPSTDNVGVAGYYVLRAEKGGSFTTLGQGSGTSFIDNTVSPGTSYNYEVEAYDAAANVSAPSTPASVTTPIPVVAPNPPTNLVATAVSTSQINLSWTETSNVKAFEIYENGGTTPIAIVGTTSYGVTNLSANTSYSFYVIASVGTESSKPSATVSATTLTPPPPPTTTTVWGVVTSATTHNPLPYVHVYTDTKQINAYTNNAGQYVLVGIPPNHKFDYHFSLRGYKTKVYVERYSAGLHLLNGVMNP